MKNAIAIVTVSVLSLFAVCDASAKICKAKGVTCTYGSAGDCATECPDNKCCVTKDGGCHWFWGYPIDPVCSCVPCDGPIGTGARLSEVSQSLSTSEALAFSQPKSESKDPFLFYGLGTLLVSGSGWLRRKKAV